MPERPDPVLRRYIDHASRRGPILYWPPASDKYAGPVEAVLVHWPPNGGCKARIEFATGHRRTVDIEGVELVPEVSL